MNKANISESDLARALNLPYNTIHRLLNGDTTDPRISTLKLIASYFKVSLDYLFASNNSYTQGESVIKKVPIVTWEQISETLLINNRSWNDWLPITIVSTEEISKNAYAVESRPSMQPRFPVGTFFIIEPDCNPVDGDLVLIKIKQNKAISLRELVIDPPTTQLLPIVENSEIISFSNELHEIVGVVVLSMHYFRRS